jgi:hypothetical protein
MMNSESALLGRMRHEMENGCRILAEEHEGTDHLADLDVAQIMILKCAT